VLTLDVRLVLKTTDGAVIGIPTTMASSKRRSSIPPRKSA